MPIAYFLSLPKAESIEVDFVDPEDNILTIRLLVDSGFTGQAGIVLPHEASSLVHSFLQHGIAAGALSGLQTRGWVLCRVPVADFQDSMIAIFSDLAPLRLPVGVNGMVGLTFLRRFDRWGAERGRDGQWRFLLESSSQKYTT
jgi:hypothetical protein